MTTVVPGGRGAAPAGATTAPGQELIATLRDIDYARHLGFGTGARLIAHDAREPSTLPPAAIDLIVTSPPYPNNYDYADATRLEMTFWGEIGSWGDLQQAVRKHMLGQLALSAGFRSYAFEKLRDRNIKWKNRKHRVPLHEGRLWIEGLGVHGEFSCG